jgi:dolichol-phosphate mannosyltransferase
MTTSLSIVIPLYKCSYFIEELIQRITNSLSPLKKCDYEIIFVNDNSPLSDWQIVIENAKINSKVKGVCFSKNFGQHCAITAGLKYAKGEWVVVMDGDLQDQPEEIPKLLEEVYKGYQIVFAKRTNRKDSYWKRLGSNLFYKVLAYLTETEQNQDIANFGIYHHNVVKAILEMGDYVRYFPTMVKWVGFKSSTIQVEHSYRMDGKSGYNLRSLLKLALNTILSFSEKPLRLTVKLGIFISCLSFSFALYILYKSITNQITVSGYSSLIISIWFLSGVMITLLGMVGLYIGKIFDQVKNRPTYIVSETVNIHSDEN